MTNELIPAGSFQPNKYDDDLFDVVAKGGDWLPRVQLVGSNSTLNKKSIVTQGSYALITSKDAVEDLTKEFNCLGITWRPKAMRIDDDSVTNFYDPSNTEFAKVQALSDEKDSGCMFGPEFLIWIQNAKKFATFYFNSKTMRREAPNLKKLLGSAATVKSRLIETKKYSWFGPVVTSCSVPFDIPSLDVIKEQADKFNNPPVSEQESAAPETRSR